MTPQEINEFVAQKLGYKKGNLVVGTNTKGQPVENKEWVTPEGKLAYWLPDYAGSIQAAWEVVEHIRERPNPDALINPSYAFELHATPSAWVAIISGPTWKQMVKGESETAPMAICLAFLKLTVTD